MFVLVHTCLRWFAGTINIYLFITNFKIPGDSGSWQPWTGLFLARQEFWPTTFSPLLNFMRKMPHKVISFRYVHCIKVIVPPPTPKYNVRSISLKNAGEIVDSVLWNVSKIWSELYNIGSNVKISMDSLLIFN